MWLCCVILICYALPSLSLVYSPNQMGELYKKNGQQLYSKDFVAEDNTGLENKILKNE